MTLVCDRQRRARRGLLRAAVWLAVLGGGPAAPAAAGVDLARDSVLAALVRDALANRPELAQARATAQADLARVPQARALPDPVVSLGIQNDGFGSLQVGRMETSYWSVAAAQTFPAIGKRGLRARTASLGAKQSEADLARARLSIQAEVERAYLDLLLARDQLGSLGKLEALWAQAEGLARARYEAGEGAQSDVLRAQLERSRLRQRRWVLLAEERRRAAALDRAAGRPLGQPVPATPSLGDVTDPALPDSAEAAADAEARTPELVRARLGVEQADALVALARRDYLPDLTVSAGVMPRGGEFEPMAQAGVSLSLPLWAGRRQSRAVAESRLRTEAAAEGAEGVRRLIRQRLEERRVMLAALLETNRLYRSGLLIQSEAAVASALAQYQVGRVPFASVLEALSGYLADEVGYYGSVAAAQRIDIAQRELSLDPVAGPDLAGLGGTPMPGGVGMAPASAPAGAASPATSTGSTSSAMPRM